MTGVIIQGITGDAGSFQTRLMLDFGTRIVAGVTPGRQGQRVHGIPVYNTIKASLKKHKASWSVLFVPAPHAKEAALEALSAKLNIVIISEHVPVHDAIEIIAYAKKVKRQVFGPNCPGSAIPGGMKLGIMPNHIFTKGDVGVVSRSGTLTYEIVHQLSRHKLGQSACIGIGGDPCVGTNFVDVLKQFQKDKKTKRIVLIGELGGALEEQAAAFAKRHMTKPIVAYIAGVSAPRGKQMGHAGAIAGSKGTAADKIEALKEAGIKVARTPSDVVRLLQ